MSQTYIEKCRELNIDEMMILSEILDRVDIQNYVDHLTGTKLDNIFKMLKTENKNDTAIKGMQMLIALDAFAYISQKIYKAKDLLVSLLASYTGENEKLISKYGVNQLLIIFKSLFINGLWDAVKTIVNFNSLEKKIETLQK